MFKNITPHIITGTLPDFVMLEKALQKMPFVPTTGQQNKSVGWVPPRADGGLFVESVNGQLIMRFMVETRQVPASVVRSRVDELAAEIEASTGRKPGKKERRDLQEQAVTELLPNAFPRKRATWVWIDREKSRLIIDSTSAGVVDDIIIALVKLVDGFVAEPLRTVMSLSVAMADWLTSWDDPGDFEALRDLLSKKPIIGSGQTQYDRLIKAARNIEQSVNSSSSWGRIGPDDSDIAWQEFKALTSDVCTLIDSPPDNEALKAERARSGLEHRKAVQEAVAEAVAAERDRLCAAIKAADDKASDDDYMLDSDDCISVIRGTWGTP